MLARLFKSPAFVLALFAFVAMGIGLGGVVGTSAGVWGGAVSTGLVALIGALVAVAIVPADVVRGSSITAAAVREAGDGRRTRRPSDVTPGDAELFDALDEIADNVEEGDKEEEELEGKLKDAEERGQRALGELRQIEERMSRAVVDRDAINAARAELELRVARADDDHKRVDRALGEVAASITGQLDQLGAGFEEQMTAVEQTARSMQEVNAQLQQLSTNVEALASNAEESSSSILEMTATNDEVAENTANLASSVRETVSSIEEMTYSIKEVARNVDALSLTAEETSSSMNQMDVSIDQVQSNANETARLSEQVARDAEIGADAILKTIQEINRIKDSSSEAVSVISNLGTRIEAIGDILDVIDDVAEQTNLLALNAAIIAAQAGEHGKGFAVVADEIKDLAERAGASTREIAELIKAIQNESKRGISAVEKGAQTVDRGVEVSAEAETALKKILDSSQKSTAMVRAIARATVEQAKGSKQVTDAIGRIAETVQQIAAATAEQARGSELIMKSAEKMRLITQHVERSSQEQARGGRQISQAIENISSMVNQLHQSHRLQARNSEQTVGAAKRIGELTRQYDTQLKEIGRLADRLAKLG